MLLMATVLDIISCSGDLSKEKAEVWAKMKVLLGARQWSKVVGVVCGQKSQKDMQLIQVLLSPRREGWWDDHRRLLALFSAVWQCQQQQHRLFCRFGVTIYFGSQWWHESKSQGSSMLARECLHVVNEMINSSSLKPVSKSTGSFRCYSAFENSVNNATFTNQHHPQ